MPRFRVAGFPGRSEIEFAHLKRVMLQGLGVLAISHNYA